MIFMLDNVQHGAMPFTMPPAPGAPGEPEAGRIVEFMDGTSGILIRFALPQAQADDLAKQLTSDPAKKIIHAPASMADAARRGPT